MYGMSVSEQILGRGEDFPKIYLPNSLSLSLPAQWDLLGFFPFRFDCPPDWELCSNPISIEMFMYRNVEVNYDDIMI